MHENRYQITKRATLVSAAWNIILSVLKIAFGYIGHSQALIADGIHSFSDLLTDFLILIAAKTGSKEADKNHPYGHGRIETASTIVVALVLIAVGAGLAIEAVNRIINQTNLRIPDAYVLVVAFITLIINQWLYRYLLKLSIKIRSELLKSNALHHQSDVYTSVVVLLSVAASIAGYPLIDSIGAIIIALMIIHMGGGIIFRAFRELVDTAVDDEKLEKIKSIISHTEGVKDLHQVRTRTIANDIFIDVHVLVDSYLSVSEGHFIGEQVEKNLINQLNDVQDVVVHIDPENDETVHPNRPLESRKNIIDSIQPYLPPSLEHSDAYYQIHYLQGQIEVDLILPINGMKKNSTLEIEIHHSFDQILKNFPSIRKFQLLFKAG